MEILALYRCPEALPDAMIAGARHLAGILDGFALVYRKGMAGAEPDGWAGFSCSADAQAAGTELDRFRAHVETSDQPLRIDSPREPERVWTRAAGGVWGIPLQFNGRVLGVALVGCPGSWPRVRNSEIDATARQLALVMDHDRLANSDSDETIGTDHMLELSEQLLAHEISLKRADEKMVQIEKARDELVEKLSHELRMPVHGIIERVIAVLTAEHEALSPASRQTLRQALDDGATFLRTLQHMLDLWRLKQDASPIELREVNLYELVEEAQFNVQDRVQPGVEIRQNIPVGYPTVRTDLAKMSQLLFLLLDNAVKFTPSGTIGIELSLEEGQLLCTVSDTGIGIAPSDRKQVFEEFFQVDSPEGGHYHGAGLGLSLARALVNRLGGAISVTSEIGQGSRFSFTLPLSVSDGSQTQPR